MVINLISSNSSSYGPFGHIIDDIRCLVGSFHSCSWSFTRRDGNGVAHSLAKHVLNVLVIDVWMEEAPLFLLPSFQVDYELVC